MKKTQSEVSASLVERLWNLFLARVSYARFYTERVTGRGGKVVPDHLGFRSLNCHTGEQPEGIQGVSHIFESLGFLVVNTYNFPLRNLKAQHLELPGSRLPKTFVSQLETAHLPRWCRQLISDSVRNTPYLLSDRGIELLNKLKKEGSLTCEGATILENELAGYFQRPWLPPEKEVVLKINDVNHYAAWVLLHGNAPSHFAMLINEQKARGWSDLKIISKAMRQAGIPMKHRIAGSPDSSLQQSATRAVKEDVVVKEDGESSLLQWTYGYLELIRRNPVAENKDLLFDGFLESHESELYQMTVTLEN